MERAAGNPAALDKVFVAVDEERGRSTLLWALQNLAKEGAMVVIVHVHCPSQTIPVMGVEVLHTMTNPQVVDAYREKERARVEQKLDEYLQICTRYKFHCQKVTTVNDEIAKGLEELISLLGITNLVVGAAADERYSDALFSWSLNWSKTACRLAEGASESCKIWFTCKGHLICNREGYRKSFPTLPLPSQHEEALREAQHFREKAHEESIKRQKTEQCLLYAIQEAGEWKMLHQHEMQQRQAIEELQQQERQELSEIIRQFEAVYDQLDDAKELKRHVTEIESARKDQKEELATSKYLVEMLQAGKEKLQQYLNQCLTEMESTRKDHEEELEKSKSLVEMLQADKEKLQEELKLSITEMESAREGHREELATSNHLIKTLQTDKKKLKQELKRCITDMESSTRKYQEEEATSKYLLEMLQADKTKLQEELDAALIEVEDLRRKSCLSSASETEDPSAPSYFICPISQDVMSDPHIAADGFTYEGEQIREWLDSGHDTSPMTNLNLAHSVLTPNRALRSAIIEWQEQKQHYAPAIQSCTIKRHPSSLLAAAMRRMRIQSKRRR